MRTSKRYGGLSASMHRASEALERCFLLVDQGDNDITVSASFRLRISAIAVEDAGIDHGIARIRARNAPRGEMSAGILMVDCGRIASTGAGRDRP